MPKQSTTVAPADEEEGIETVELTFFGEKFPVLKAMNMFKFMGVFDPDEPAALVRYLIESVAKSERGRFKDTVARQQFMSMDDLLKMFAEVTEAQGDGRPTKSSPASPNGSVKRAVRTRSVGTYSPEE